MKVSLARGSISPKQVAILLAISLGLMLLPPPWQENPKLYVSSVAVPAQWLAMSGTRHAGAWLSLALDRIFGESSAGRSLSVAELQKKVEELELRLACQEELLRDAQAKLANLTGDTALTPKRVAIANVIAQDSSDWRKSVIVDCGSRHGVQPGMIACWNGALVGRVSAVTPLSSRIRLITEPSSEVSVRSARSRAAGILQGTGTDLCRVKYVGGADDMQVGDLIVTAGLGGAFPPHLLVGKCVRSEASGGAMQRDVMVAPSICPRKLESVVIGAWTPPETSVESATEKSKP